MVTTQQFPYPPYLSDSGYSMFLQNILPFFITLSYVFISPTLIKHIVREKELGIKELMKLMGIPGWIQWIGWFLSAFIMMTVSAGIIVGLLCSDTLGLPVLSHTAWELLLFIFVLYIASAICSCFFITSFFSKPTLATSVGVLFWMLSFLVPYYNLNAAYTSIGLFEKLLVSLFPNMAMAWAMRFVISFEGKDKGLQWSNLNEPSYPGDQMTMVHILIMFVVDIILYSFLTWYMDHVFPGDFGVRKPWYFVFTKDYWCGNNKKHLDLDIVNDHPKNSPNFEREPTDLSSTIIIQNLTKRYGWRDQEKVAVDKINLNIFEGQITALLGHNGAGKTTTMSMLTGMFPPTNGTAFINGHDIRYEIDAARDSLGLCPQHNMLFSTLTVKEHLLFFGKLKIRCNKELELEVNELMKRIQLWDKRNQFAQSLSGGMKRKLNLGIALIGGPKIVMLDEPTSGMDPEARREIWDILQEFRVGRCILLTTHFMEEADVLGDRIAIMSQGQIECCGSPMFLKKRYGAGYHLNITKDNQCNVEAICNTVQQHVAGAYIKSSTNVEVCIILPSENTDMFSEMLQDLEDNMQNMGIINFGISVTTMEEVFLNVGESVSDKNDIEANFHQSNSASILAPNHSIGITPRVQNVRAVLLREQLYGLLLKRWYYAHRRWILLLAQILLPILMVLTVLLLNNKIDELSSIYPSLPMNITQYGNTYAFYTNSKNKTEIGEKYEVSFPTSTKVRWKSDGMTFLEDIGVHDFQSYRTKHIVGADFDLSESFKFKTNAWYNGLYYHSQPLSLNLIHNAMVKYYANESYSVVVENAPFPSDANRTQSLNEGLMYVKSIMMGVFIPVGLSFLSSSFVVFPIHERASKSKHLQLMTGVGGCSFWLANFIWDYATHIISALAMLLLFIFVDNTQSFSGDKSGIVCLLLFLYGWSSIPFTYLVSFMARLPATGFSRLTVLNLIAGIILSITMFFFQIAGSYALVDTNNILRWFLRLLPNFSITMAFMNMAYVSSMKKIPFGCLLQKNFKCIDNYLQWDTPGIGQEVMMLVVTGALYFVLLAVIERGLFYNLWYIIQKMFRRNQNNTNCSTDQCIGILDTDVATERERVDSIVSGGGVPSDDVLIVHDLSKQFWSFLAVNHLHFGVRSAECFGLLGVNGAGKTTTFNMLTGDLIVTSGNAYIRGISLKDNRSQFLKQIGYCPQFDALLDYLTGREMLYVFARLRGIANFQIKDTVDDFIVKFDLVEHADKITLHYSGGTKRKLSAALAFIGDPPIVFLDEPTTGVDPVARRKIWEILSAANDSGMAVVLTSHSMEECEVLCSRVAIMVNGQFQCFGGVQYLKNKFSQGFTILAKLKKRGDELQQQEVQKQLQEFIELKFPSASLKDIHQGLVHYHVCDVATKWTHLFSTMEEAKRHFDLEDYSVSQATLEQVFLSFAKKQRAMDANKKSN